MSVVLGSGAYRYETTPGWGSGILPGGIGEVGGVAVDGKDRVYVFHRGRTPVLILEEDGTPVGAWGEGLFSRPHGIHVAEQSVYLTDDGGHTVRRFNVDGEMDLVLGAHGSTPGFMTGRPFCRCTHTALSPSGEIYVSDGYGNARIHKYDPDGTFMFSWGSPGIGPGEFNLPHNIVTDEEGRLYVADRENHRIQVFDESGNLLDVWHNLHRPSALCRATIDGVTTFVVGEIGPYSRSNRGTPNLGPRLSILDSDGHVVARLQSNPAGGPLDGQFVSPHGVAVDSAGNIYVGEVAHTAWPMLMPETPRPEGLRVLQKLRRITD
jgi:DNA-binding beta-propeller fold protein YncE